jgi:hypothetical protein
MQRGEPMQAVEVQLARLDACFVPLHPITLRDGKPNPRHVAMRHEYHRCLSGFTPQELELGFDDLIASHKWQKWPSPAECQQACQAHHKRRDHTPRLMQPEGPTTEFSDRHRAEMRRGLRNIDKWYRSGEIQHRTAAQARSTPCDRPDIENALREAENRLSDDIPF